MTMVRRFTACSNLVAAGSLGDQKQLFFQPLVGAGQERLLALGGNLSPNPSRTRSCWPKWIASVLPNPINAVSERVWDRRRAISAIAVILPCNAHTGHFHPDWQWDQLLWFSTWFGQWASRSHGSLRCLLTALPKSNSILSKPDYEHIVRIRRGFRLPCHSLSCCSVG